LVDALERAKEGQGQAMSIVAPAGGGKSRILYEFRKGVASEDVTFLEGKCLSYSRGVAYHPVIDILKGNFDIRDGERDEEIKDKVRRGLEILRVDEASTLPFLLELLGVKDSGFDPRSLSPEGKKDRTIQAIARLVLKGAEIRPLILVVEDLHWMDESSEDVFQDLVEHIAGARVLLIFTYRPEYVHTWGQRSYHNHVHLNRLSGRESLEMVTHFLGTEHLDRNLADLILEKTEGVPFFIEEFVKSLQDLRIIERQDHTWSLARDPKDVTIPATIQDVLMARVDALPEGAKEVLQVGSVIEREFPHALLERVTGLPERELLSRLSALKDAELLYERGVYPQSSYIFKHALTRGVLYDSILTKRRRELHEAVGAVTEALYAEELQDHAAILCEHFAAAENHAKAADYARRAGRQAERAGAFAAAVAYGERRVLCLEKLPRTEAAQRAAIEARARLGLYYGQKSDWRRAFAAVQPVLDAAKTAASKKTLSQLVSVVGFYESVCEEDFARALGHMAEALRLAEAANDTPSLFFAHYGYHLALWGCCRFAEAVHHVQQALEINRAAQNRIGIASMTSHISVVRSWSGQVDQAYQESLEAVRVSEESGDLASRALSYTCHGLSCFRRGCFQEAKEILLESIAACGRADMPLFRAYAHAWMADTQDALGEHRPALDLYEQAIHGYDSIGAYPSRANLYRVCMHRSQAALGTIDCTPEELGRYAAANKLKLFEGPIRRSIAETLLHSGRHYWNEAEDWIHDAIRADRENGTRWDLAMDHAVYGELGQRKGDTAQAREHLDQAIEVFQECGADGWVRRAEEKLAQL
jgi:tetratricopeptide (TPR) repeat protein